MKLVYLDNAATTPIDSEVIKIITKTMTEIYGNPSSTHQFGRKAKVLVEESRKSIAKHFNVTAGELVFTAGGSEADNLILRNAIVNLGVKRIITSKIEHHAVLHPIQALQKEFNIPVDYVKLDEEGRINFQNLNALLKQNDKTLVSLMYVNNELGNVLDIQRVSNICIENKALFHSDTVQGIGYYNIDLFKTPIDFITASAHKFHGPKGVGFAIIKKGFGIQPMLIGGEQERGARAGTENVHNIAGMQKALDLALSNLEADKQYITELKDYFISRLKTIVPQISFNGCSENSEESLYKIVNVRFTSEIPMMLFNLDLKGIAVSGGSACQSGSNKGSHVLNTILSEEEAEKTSIRFSFSRFLTKEDLDYALDAIKDLIPPIKK